MKSVRLTRRAASRLEDIAAWTIDHFGPAQASKYEGQLIRRLNALAAGDPPRGRSCSLLAPGLTAAAGLLYVREGGHFIVYRETDVAIQVIDFIHGARDLDGILRDLGKKPI
ncbi:MAG: type II toxin-antitoxin system RelE/ParE family toxin [Hyphomicrobiales bacterium]|nr:type II toxin-antitoxin system RelE/ParE family toxin [Hyphomicrobiales bacterium]MCP5372593.1 type II toxin-antitoxin system RelE/ParE family toxin [Hyphomicrobiales bacterium]